MSTTRRRIVVAGTLATAAIGGALALATPAFAAPFNDNFASAQFLPGPNNSISGRTDLGATTEIFEQFHGGQPPHASIWYRWTAPASGRTIFRTFGSDFDTVLSVYTGNTLQNLKSVGESDDTTLANGTRVAQSQVAFNATKGTEYHVAVDGV